MFIAARRGEWGDRGCACGVHAGDRTAGGLQHDGDGEGRRCDRAGAGAVFPDLQSYQHKHRLSGSALHATGACTCIASRSVSQSHQNTVTLEVQKPAKQ